LTIVHIHTEEMIRLVQLLLLGQPMNHYSCCSHTRKVPFYTSWGLIPLRSQG